MDKLGYIEIRITGTKGNIEFKPETYDIPIGYNTKYDAVYLKKLRNKAMRWLTKTDTDAWLREIRGYDAS